MRFDAGKVAEKDWNPRKKFAGKSATVWRQVRIITNHYKWPIDMDTRGISIWARFLRSIVASDVIRRESA